MVLADDVKDRSGRCLLAAGAEVTPKNLRLLRTWGVSEVNVEGEGEGGEVSTDGDLSVEVLEKVAAQLRPLWRNVDLDSPMMKELFRLCVIRKAEHDHV